MVGTTTGEGVTEVGMTGEGVKDTEAMEIATNRRGKRGAAPQSYAQLSVTAARTSSTRGPAGGPCPHVPAVDAEAVEGVPGQEPLATFLTSLQFALLNEHEDSQIGGAELFRGFQDRHCFPCIDLFFHGDASLDEMSGRYGRYLFLLAIPASI